MAAAVATFRLSVRLWAERAMVATELAASSQACEGP
jgi:hypothetical protein